MKKRLLSITLAFLCAFSALPATLLPTLAVDTPPALTSGADEGNGAQSATDPYAALYVQDDLIFRWDAFDLLDTGATATTVTLTDRDGRNVTLSLPNATPKDGYLASTSNLNFTAIVPKDGQDYADMSFDASIVQLGDVISWPTLSLGTIDLTEGTGGNAAPNASHGNFLGTYKPYIDATATTTVSYYFDTDGKLLAEKPSSGEYREVKIPYLTMSTKQYGTDHDSWIRFYGNYKNESYSIGGSLDYTVTGGYGSFDLMLYRDMQALKPSKTQTGYPNISYARGVNSSTYKNAPVTYTQILPAATGDKTAYEVALLMAQNPPAANGTYGGATSPDIFAIGGGEGKKGAVGSVGYYAFRLYSDILTADEYLQNHFADLCAFHKISNAEIFLSLSDASKKALYQQFAKADTTKGDVEIYNTSYEDVTKKQLEDAIADAYAEEKGLFDKTYVTFDGFQLSQFTSVGMRAVFTLDKSALAELPAGITMTELGVLHAEKNAHVMSDLTVAQNGEGVFVAPEGVTLSHVQTAGANGAGVISENEQALVFADTLFFDDATLDDSVFGEYIFRAYAVFESTGSTVVVYTDGEGTSENLLDGASLYELTAKLCEADMACAHYSENKKVLTSVMKQIDFLKNNFRANSKAIAELLGAICDADSEFSRMVTDAERLLATVKTARNKALKETSASVRQGYLDTATSALDTVKGYVSALSTLKAVNARNAADEMLLLLGEMDAEYKNLTAFANITKVEGLDAFFAEAAKNMEDATVHCRTLLPTVKSAYDRMFAIQTVLGDFKTEIENTAGDGKGVTQVFLFAASTTTDNYPAAKQFPWQGFGYEFDEYFDDTVSVVNPSIAGWGLKSLTGSYKQNNENLDELFAAENSPWAKMLMRLNPGDYVFFGSTGANEKWQTGGDVYYIENPDGTYSITNEKTPGAKYYSVMQSPEAYKAMLVELGKILIDMGVTPIFCTSFGNLGVKDTVTSTADFTSGTKDHEAIKFAVVDELNEYYRAKNGDQGNYAYLSDAAERCREVFLADMKGGMTYKQLLDKYNRTQGALEAFYAKYGFVGSSLTKHLTGDEKVEEDKVHQNIHGALLISSMTLKDLQGSGLPLLDHVVTYELDEVELICNTLKEAGVSYTDPREK